MCLTKSFLNRSLSPESCPIETKAPIPLLVTLLCVRRVPKLMLPCRVVAKSLPVFSPGIKLSWLECVVWCTSRPLPQSSSGFSSLTALFSLYWNHSAQNRLFSLQNFHSSANGLQPARPCCWCVANACQKRANNEIVELKKRIARKWTWANTTFTAICVCAQVNQIH